MAKTVLHVEDDEDDIWLFKHAMEKAGPGCSLRHARDGQAAIDYFARPGVMGPDAWSLPDLVLLDLKLPEVPGLEVLKWMRNEGGLSIPILILSSSQNDRDVEEAYKLGANAYLVKPCELTQLQEMARMIRGFWLFQNTPPPGARIIAGTRRAVLNRDVRQPAPVSF